MGKRRFTEGAYENDPWFRGLCSAVSACKDEQEVADLLRDIGTLSELQAWSERLEVAKQLSQGLTYRQVSANTGASTTTVTRVAKYIENGVGGYKQFLKAQKSKRSHKRFETPEVIKQDKAEAVLRKYL
ncbi:MAG: YerC/YecD family TrpR-related protein [Candidatus Peribacteraceae bacterium]|nr:YerC/YecD family TrpR-related protein [Candidatus Peribacteraceae bacterium]